MIDVVMLKPPVTSLTCVGWYSSILSTIHNSSGSSSSGSGMGMVGGTGGTVIPGPGRMVAIPDAPAESSVEDEAVLCGAACCLAFFSCGRFLLLAVVDAEPVGDGVPTVPLFPCMFCCAFGCGAVGVEERVTSVTALMACVCCCRCHASWRRMACQARWTSASEMGTCAVCTCWVCPR